jgi:hypothetical protein
VNHYSTIWRHNSRRMAHWDLKAVMSSELYAVNSERESEQQASAEAWELILDQRHPTWRDRVKGLEESELLPVRFTSQFNGRVVSNDFYKKLNLALYVLESKPINVVEIGAGWGQVARIIHRLAPEIQYAIIDIPETLRWSKEFLSMEQVPCRFISALDESWGGPYDVMLNSSSFGEMPIAISKSYLNWSKIQCGRSVMLNRLLNTYDPWTERQRERECGWYFHADPKAKVERMELEPDFTRINGPETWGHHREVLLILRHNEADQDSPDCPIGAWLSSRQRRPSNRGSNILGPDMTVLESLLEKVRREPTKTSLDRLLSYLEAIRLKHPFEELPQLWRRYADLSGHCHWTDRDYNAALQRLTSAISRIVWNVRNPDPQ